MPNDVTQTTGLIDRLVSELQPVSPWAVLRRLAAGIGAGVVVAGILTAMWLGVRPDLTVAVTTGAYWIKFAYTAVIAAAGVLAVERLSRPDGRAARAVWIGIAAVALTAAAAIAQFVNSPAEAHSTLIFGASADACPINIVVIALPILIGAAWAVRGLAPTRLGATGLAMGLMAGGLAAWVYSFHCNEAGVPFLVLWYSAGIVATGIVGALVGRLVLRWR